MSDNIVEITENTNYTISVETSLEQNNDVVIELTSPNNIDIINNTTVLIGDLPQGYPLSWTTENLPISRLAGITTASGIRYQNGTFSISGIPLEFLPVKNIIAGSGIGIVDNNGVFDIAVTGTFGLTGEQVDDRINDLLVGGEYADLSYDDNLDKLIISITGLQPSGNYSFVGHQHSIADVSGLQNSLNSKQPSGIYASGIHYHISSDITDFDNSVDFRIILANLQPSGNYSLIGHQHSTVDVSGLQNILDNKQPSGIYASGVHYHLSSDITDFNLAVSGLLPVKNVSSGSGILVTSTDGDFNVAVTGTFGLTSEQVDDRINDLLVGTNNIVLSYDDNLDKLVIGTSGLQASGNYSVEGHSHIISDVSGLQNTLDNKQPSGSYSPLIHTHASSDITDFSDSVNILVSGIYAPLFSPAFSGIPTVPTAPSGTNSNQIASTSFVRTEIANLVDSSPSTLDTLNELAAALGDDPNFATTIASGLSQKSNIGHTHAATDIADFNSSVSGLLPITNITGSSGIVISNNGSTYNVFSSGLAYLTGSNFDSLNVSGIPVSVSGHLHSYTDITNWASGVENEVSTLLVPGNYININYDNIADTLTISASGLQPSGNYANSVHTHNSSDITNFNSSFDSSDFSIISGIVSVKAGGIDNNQLVNSFIGLGSVNMILGINYSSLSGVTIDGGSP